MKEHVLKTTHGAMTRIGCGRVRESLEEGNSGAGSGGGDGCTCRKATDQEVKEAVDAALEEFSLIKN